MISASAALAPAAPARAETAPASTSSASPVWWLPFQSDSPLLLAEQRPQLMHVGYARSKGLNTVVALGRGTGLPGKLTWRGWGSESAMATGMARLAGQTRTGTVDPETRDVQVTLSGITRCGGASIYTTLAVSIDQPELGDPSWKPRVDAIPPRRCWPADGCPEGVATCTGDRVDGFVSHMPFRHTPKRGRATINSSPFHPFKADASGTHEYEIQGWGTETAVVTGFYLQADQKVIGPPCRSATPGACFRTYVYAVRWTLHAPRWCADRGLIVGTGLRYTSAKVEIFGNNTVLRGQARGKHSLHRRYGRLLRRIGTSKPSKVAYSLLSRLESARGRVIDYHCAA